MGVVGRGEPVPDIPGYRIDRLLGEGGMGRVWHAVRASDGHEVAIKLILPQRAGIDPASSKAYFKRFRREMQVLAGFAHPNVLKALDGGVLADGVTPWLATEFLEGVSLADHPGYGELPEPVCRDVLAQLIEAFGYLHPQGLVHRDIKPSNVFVTSDGRVVLLDFGLAFESQVTRITATGELAGTPFALAPEQLTMQPLGPWTDVFQLGVTLYMALTDAQPFGSSGLLAVACGGEVPTVTPPRQHRPELSEGLSRLVLGCLVLEPSERYQGAEDLRRALAALDRGAVPSLPVVRPRPVAPRAPAASTGRRFFAVGAGLLALAAVLGLLVGRWSSGGAPAPREELGRELPLLRDQVLREGRPPTDEDAAVVGELLAASGERDRLGLPSGLTPSALGLLYLVKTAVDAREPAVRAQAPRLAWSLLERHGLPEGRAASDVLRAVDPSVLTAAERGAVMERLRRLRGGGVAPSVAPLLDVHLARLLLDDYARRRPKDTFLDRELKGFAELVAEVDPAVEEAARLLRAVVLGRLEPPPFVESAAAWLEALHILRTRAARRDALAALPMLLAAGGPARVELRPALQRAASLLELRARDFDEAEQRDVAAAGLPVLRRLYEGCSEPRWAALFRLYFARAQLRAGQARAGLETLLATPVDSLARDERWRWWHLAGDLRREVPGAGSATAAYRAGLEVAPPGPVTVFLKFMSVNLPVQEALFGGRREAK